MAKQFTPNPVWAVRVEEDFSYKNQSRFWRIEFVDEVNRDIYNTYISSGNHNLRNWADLIDLLCEGDYAVRYDAGLPIKKGDTINADYKPQPTHITPLSEVVDAFNGW